MRQISLPRQSFSRRMRLKVGAAILPLDARIMLIQGMEVRLAHEAIDRMEIAKRRGDVGEEDQMRTLLKSLGVQHINPEEQEEWEL